MPVNVIPGTTVGVAFSASGADDGSAIVIARQAAHAMDPATTGVFAHSIVFSLSPGGGPTDRTHRCCEPTLERPVTHGLSAAHDDVRRQGRPDVAQIRNICPWQPSRPTVKRFKRILCRRATRR